MNLVFMMRDLSKLKAKTWKEFQNGHTVGENYAGKFIHQGVCLAIEIVAKYVYANRRKGGHHA
jgi:hypothetical protein